MRSSLLGKGERAERLLALYPALFWMIGLIPNHSVASTIAVPVLAVILLVIIALNIWTLSCGPPATEYSERADYVFRISYDCCAYVGFVMSFCAHWTLRKTFAQDLQTTDLMSEAQFHTARRRLRIIRVVCFVILLMSVALLPLQVIKGKVSVWESAWCGDKRVLFVFSIISFIPTSIGTIATLYHLIVVVCVIHPLMVVDPATLITPAVGTVQELEEFVAQREALRAALGGITRRNWISGSLTLSAAWFYAVCGQILVALSARSPYLFILGAPITLGFVLLITALAVVDTSFRQGALLAPCPSDHDGRVAWNTYIARAAYCNQVDANPTFRWAFLRVNASSARFVGSFSITVIASFAAIQTWAET